MEEIICGKYHNYWSHLTITVTYHGPATDQLLFHVHSYCQPLLNIVSCVYDDDDDDYDADGEDDEVLESI